MIDRTTAIELMRLLHGELDESSAHRLGQKMADRPALRSAFETLESSWLGLELPEPTQTPPGFATRVMAQARARTDDGWIPLWWRGTLIGRATTAALLVGGIVLGAMLASANDAGDWSDDFLTAESSMAENYLNAVQTAEALRWQEDGQ